MRDRLTMEERACAKTEEAHREAIKKNPLLQFSTSQLKAELQRRKIEGR